MKGLAALALFLSTAMALVAQNKTFSCPEKTWGGCCAEVDENGGGHSCHDAASADASMYTCSGNDEHSLCCHFAPWMVHAAHPLICA